MLFTLLVITDLRAQSTAAPPVVRMQDFGPDSLFYSMPGAVLSRDGRRIAFTHVFVPQPVSPDIRGVYVMHSDGTDLRRVNTFAHDFDTTADLSISDDGSVVAWVQGFKKLTSWILSDAWVWYVDTDTVINVTAQLPVRKSYFIEDIDLTGDGRQLFFSRVVDFYGTPSVGFWKLDLGSMEAFKIGNKIVSFDVSGNGRRIVTGDDLMSDLTFLFDGDGNLIQSIPAPTASAVVVAYYSLSHDGNRLAFLAGPPAQVWTLDLQTQELTSFEEQTVEPHISADGEWVSYVKRVPIGGLSFRNDVYRSRFDGTDATFLASTPGTYSRLDGDASRVLIFASDHSEDAIFIQQADFELPALKVTAPVGAGLPLALHVAGRPGQPVELIAALQRPPPGGGVQNLPPGSLVRVASGTLVGEGSFDHTLLIPDDPAILGLHAWVQALLAPEQQGNTPLTTNMLELVIGDGSF